jgi:hypothetical protein
MQSALDSAMGLPSRPISAFSMLGFVTPPDVSSSFTVPPAAIVVPNVGGQPDFTRRLQTTPPTTDKHRAAMITLAMPRPNTKARTTKAMQKVAAAVMAANAPTPSTTG